MLSFRLSFRLTNTQPRPSVCYTRKRTPVYTRGRARMRVLDDSSRREPAFSSRHDFVCRQILFNLYSKQLALSFTPLSAYPSPPLFFLFVLSHFRFFSHSSIDRPLRLSRDVIDDGSGVNARDEEGEGRRSRAAATQFNQETRFS